MNLGKAIQEEVDRSIGPPPEGNIATGQTVILRPLVRNTRGYIEKIANQANGCYQNDWYDACAVMLRRLLQTLLIECFEAHEISGKIKNSNGDFVYLRDMIDATLAEPSWNIGRNCKTAMRELKDIGDKSAHSRRYLAQRGDVDKVAAEVRLVVQELLFLSGIKK